MVVTQPMTAAAQTIPVDHFEGLRFDAPVPAVVQSGQPVALSGDLLDATWEEALFSFRPVDGAEADLDFYIQHLPGRNAASGAKGAAAAQMGYSDRLLVSRLLRGSGSAQHLRHFSVAFRMALTSVGHPVDPAFDPGDSLIGGRMAGEEPIEGGA